MLSFPIGAISLGVKVLNFTYFISEPNQIVMSQLAPNVEYIAIDIPANF